MPIHKDRKTDEITITQIIGKEDLTKRMNEGYKNNWKLWPGKIHEKADLTKENRIIPPYRREKATFALRGGGNLSKGSYSLMSILSSI